ncbi:hypothetical protein ADN00_16570 [Ornatilinea apprima]|uniref:Glycosyl hydrolase family 13 catalytic domain-containing protein n=1 Tax=Ornatilinea apprima TaxID=1134406 RepID=A0A0P6WZB2_9CHLR|nr:hypothetical protein ADN00_16570 [Ornatilinea apprima]
MTIEKRIRNSIAFLYGEGNVEWIYGRIQASIDSFLRNPRLKTPRRGSLSEKDAILITYADSFRSPERSPLETLNLFIQEQLGQAVSAVHILPFYPYSSDDGFSVVDYRQVNPEVGEWENVTSIGRHHRLMFDMVINHISRKSAWFQAYLRDEAPYRDYFITAQEAWDLSHVVRPRTLPLLSEVNTSSGPRKVWTTFSDDQIDLNFANPLVLMEGIDLMLFYVQKGAEFLRLDAIAYLWKEPGTSCIHLPQTHAVIKLMRAVLDQAAPDVFLITETNVPHQENISYFGDYLVETGRTDEAQLVYQFPLATLTLHAFRTGNARILSAWAASLDNQSLFFNFIASHDGIGIMPAKGILTEQEIQALVDQTLRHGGKVSYKSNPDGSRSPYELNITLYDLLNDPARPNPQLDSDRFIASQVLMLSLRGVPGIYFHSLFGSSNCLACLEATGEARSINRQKFDYPALAAQLENPQSRPAQVLRRYLRLLALRGQEPAFHPSGAQEVWDADPEVFALFRQSPDRSQTIFCLVNVTTHPKQLRLKHSSHSLLREPVWLDLISNQTHTPMDDCLEIHLAPYQCCWLKAVSR